jgi:hypothetical protein
MSPCWRDPEPPDNSCEFRLSGRCRRDMLDASSSHRDPLRKFGSQFSMTGLKQPGHSRLPKTLGRGRFGTEPMASWGMSAKGVMRGLNEGEPHVPAFRTDRSSPGRPSKRDLRRGETNNENDTHGAVGGRSCGRASARKFGDVCCRADDRAGGNFGRECRGDRGRAQTRRNPQTCCGAQARRSPQTCCGAQARRALTSFVDWIFAARSRRTAVRPVGTFYGAVTYLMPRHGRLLGAPSPMAAVVGHALPAASAIAG